MNEKLRPLVYALLDDEYGISQKAYYLLLDIVPEELYNEILLKVRHCEGRNYFPEGSDNNG